MTSDLFSCRGKTALVAGGAGLLGSVIARGLQAAGATVFVADTDERRARETAGHANMHVLTLDVTSESSIAAAMDMLREGGKKIDIFVYAAYPRTRDWGLAFEEVPFASWKENVDAHLGGFFLCSKAVAEKMKQQGGGSIIALASTYGIVAPDFSIYTGTSMTMPAAYAAIKGGIITFVRYLATYYARHQVRVNCISPGGVFDGQPPQFVKQYAGKTPLGRMARPDEVVGGAVFLASDASSYVTGHNLVIDGGWTAW